MAGFEGLLTPAVPILPQAPFHRVIAPDGIARDDEQEDYKHEHEDQEGIAPLQPEITKALRAEGALRFSPGDCLPAFCTAAVQLQVDTSRIPAKMEEQRQVPLGVARNQKMLADVFMTLLTELGSDRRVGK